MTEIEDTRDEKKISFWFLLLLGLSISGWVLYIRSGSVKLNITGWQLTILTLIIIAAFSYYYRKNQPLVLPEDAEVIKKTIRPWAWKNLGLFITYKGVENEPLWESEPITDAIRDFYFKQHGITIRVKAGIGLIGVRLMKLDRSLSVKEERELLRKYEGEKRVKGKAVELLREKGIEVVE